MKTDAIAPIEGKILVCRCSANKIGMMAGIAPNYLDLNSIKANSSHKKIGSSLKVVGKY
jgi:hypothetical protein